MIFFFPFVLINELLFNKFWHMERNKCIHINVFLMACSWKWLIPWLYAQYYSVTQKEALYGNISMLHLRPMRAICTSWQSFVTRQPACFTLDLLHLSPTVKSQWESINYFSLCEFSFFSLSMIFICLDAFK